MPISKGSDWGQRGVPPLDMVVVRSDSEAAALFTSHARRGSECPVVGLLGGDLCKSLGGRSGLSTSGRSETQLRSAATLVSIDVGEVSSPEGIEFFVAHLIVRRTWLRGRIRALLNAEFVGEWDVSPRGHPGDGHFELLEADPPFGDRLKARRRLPLGTHIPHPDIGISKVREAQLELAKGETVYLDGQKSKLSISVSVVVRPAALTVAV